MLRWDRDVSLLNVSEPWSLNEILITAPWSARVIVAGQNLDDEVLLPLQPTQKGSMSNLVVPQ